ncbi:protein-export chaperone SecB [Rhodospirillaceae bacterium SYSU D60014]|uniref:protein-export chaperone SecB n=1 Tax=Virgifigura deserti TaxID=2268457 RepID=UPI000E66A0F8
MSDTSTDTAPGTQAGAQNGAQPGAQRLPIIVLAQYLKDLSFENPNAPGAIREGAKPPQGQVQVDVRAKPMGESTFEVVLSLRAEAKHGEQLAYLLEMEYGGVFRTGAIPPEAVEPLIMIEGPRLLFPFARNIIMSASRDGGFAPLLINPIDFAALYREHRQRAMQAQAAGAEATA